MAKVATYHTTNDETGAGHRDVHHDHDDCSEGKKIKKENRSAGTNSKPLCKVCAKL